MAQKCYICGKKPHKGHKVSHSNRKAIRLWKPNLQSAKILVAGKVKKIKVCTKCLKKGKIKRVV